MLIGETMADQNIKIGVEITSNTDEETKRVKGLAAAYNSAAKAAAAVGGTAGSRAAAQAAGTGEGTSYGVARAAVGTGAAGRDFAQQAQGLGGLVHVYATFAANLFAVGAAFTALSKAADTSNIISGLDQLGASSGRNLGTLAKQMVAATDGAISLKEAMSSTALATSAGMTNAAILRMTDVARKASAALGRDMSDSMDRLTKGIAKTQPELLDELGIMTRVIPAQEAYARKIGKTVDSLTDFEKRQAFANAVLEEGEKKFGAISLQSNPYSKLLASLKDVGQQGLELVNMVLTPIVSILSSSPTALISVLGLIGTTLLKQALPAVGQYREGLKSASVAAAELAKSRSVAAAEAIKASNRELLAAKDLKAELQTQKIDVAQRALESAQSGRIRKDVRKILEKTPLDVTEGDIAKLDKLGATLKTQDNVYQQLSKSIKSAREANLDYIKTASQVQEAEAKVPSKFSAAGIAQYQAEKARRKAASKEIISQTSQTAAEEGLFAALGKIGPSIKEANLGVIGGTFTRISASASALVTSISGVMSVLSGFLGWIGIAVGTFQLLSSWMSKNSAETDAFNSSLDTLKETTKTATSVQAKYNDTISIASLSAKATAFGNLADNIALTTDALKAADIKAGAWDKIIDGFMGVIGKDMQDTFATNVSYSISEGLKVISDPKLKKQAEDQLKELFKTGDISKEGLNKAYSSMSPKDVLDTNEKLKTVFNTIKEGTAKAKAPLDSVSEGFKSLDTAYSDLSNSLINKDALTKFALELVKQTANISNAFEEPQNKLAILKSIMEDTSKIRMFPKDAQQGILAAAKDFETISNEVKQTEEDISSAKAKIAAGAALERGGAAPEVFMRIKMEGEGLLASATAAHKASTEKLNLINTNLSSSMNRGMQDAFKLIEAPLSRAIAQANIDTQKALLSYLPKSPETAKITSTLEVQALELRKQEITTIQNLIESNNALRISNELTELNKQRDTEKGKLLGPDKDKLAKLDLSISKNEKLLEAYSSKTLKGDVSSGKVSMTPEIATLLAQRSGVAVQLEGINAQEKASIIKSVVDTVTSSYTMTKEALQREIDQTKAENLKFYQGQQYLAMPPEEQAREKAKRDAAEAAAAGRLSIVGGAEKVGIAQTIQAQAGARGFKDVETAARNAAALAQTELDATKERLTLGIQTAATESERNIQVKEYTSEVVRANSIYESYSLKQQDSIIADKQIVEFKQQQLSILESTNQISKEEAGARKLLLDIDVADLDRKTKLLDIEKTKNKELQDWTVKYLEAGAQLTPQLETERDLIIQRANIAETAATREYDSRTKLAQLAKEQTTRQATYNDTFRSTFLSMGDALVDFAMTGKQSFGDMIKSMITDLAKFEIRMMMMKSWQGSGTGMVDKLAGWIGGGLSGGTPSAANTVIPMQPGGGYAKGDVFGVEAFAQGGAFTNSIVNSPTMFKFAQGTGLMGEAGPEAIMPLKRDANGNLGVRTGGQGTTSVVVNNYGTEQATTRESTDSKGNRRIEVIIGEAVAKEVGRANSPVNSGIRNNFQVQPNLVRR